MGQNQACDLNVKYKNDVMIMWKVVLDAAIAKEG